MMKINKSPVLTCEHYGTNCFEANEEICKGKTAKFGTNNVSYENENDISISELKTIPKNNLSDDIDNFIESNSNFTKEIVISKNSVTPLVVDFNSTQNLTDTIVLTVEKNISAKVVFKYFANEIEYHYATLKIVLKDGAMLDFAELFAFEQTNNFVSIEVDCEKNSHINFNVVDINSQVSVQNIKFVQSGENSAVRLNSIYLANKKCDLSLNYLFEIFGKNCNSQMLASGVLNDEARKNFLGTIDFKKGSTKSVGSEDEFCTMLSKNCKSKSTPILLCHEEDVDGKHSSSVGKADEESLFYVMSRGIDKSEATKLLVMSKLKKHVDMIFDDKLKTQIIQILENWLDDKN